MMSQHFMGQSPFKDVYIHGLVLDENGKKMSKSLGNGIDPLLLIEKYGTDALRYTLIKEVAGAGQDIRMEYNRETDESVSVQASRNFCNKLWNASRFAMMNLEGQTPQQLGSPLSHPEEKREGGLEALELCDRWILSRYHQTIQNTSNYIDKYGLGEAAKGLYEFIWGDFCDWYIELVKPRLQGEDIVSKRVAQEIIAQVLEGILKLMHPFMPHITEEIWQTLTQADPGKSLAVEAYPELQVGLIQDGLEQDFELIIGTISTIRNLRAEADIKPNVKGNVILQSDSESERRILKSGASYLKLLGKVEELIVTPSLEKEPAQSIASVVGTVQVIMPLAGTIDVEAFKAKLEKKLGKVEGEIKSLTGRLSNPKFVNKAPAEVVQGAKDALAEAEKQAEILRDRLNRFKQ